MTTKETQVLPLFWGLIFSVFSVVGDEKYQCPALSVLQDRAHPAKLSEVSSSPSIYHVRGLLTPSEVKELIDLALKGMSTHQEYRDIAHSTVSLDKATALNASQPVQKLNKRLSLLTGFPETHIEEGYFSVYNSGYRMKSLHLDNHHALFNPKRVLSFVIYLVSEDEYAGTVFPLAKAQQPDNEAQKGVGRSPPLDENGVNAWNKRTDSSTFTMGQDPQAGRTCTESHDECRTLMATAHHACDSGKAQALAPGDAVMFYQHQDGLESIRTIHAGCSMRQSHAQKNKVVLAKFIRNGPRPFTDEEVFMAALSARRKR